MGIYEKIRALPDCMNSIDLRTIYIEILNEDKNGKYSKVEIARALWELSNRQWHTYELIDDELKILIADWIEKSWDLMPIDRLHLIVGICAMLAIPKGLELLNRTIEKITDRGIAAELNDERVDLEKSVIDPFYDMKKFK